MALGPTSRDSNSSHIGADYQQHHDVDMPDVENTEETDAIESFADPRASESHENRWQNLQAIPRQGTAFTAAHKAEDGIASTAPNPGLDQDTPGLDIGKEHLPERIETSTRVGNDVAIKLRNFVASPQRATRPGLEAHHKKTGVSQQGKESKQLIEGGQSHRPPGK